MSNATEAASSRITVSWNQLTFFIVYAFGLAGLGAWMAARTSYGFLGVVMIVCAVAVLYGKVARGSGKAPCPVCGRVLDDLQRGGRNPSVLCEGCGRFQEGEGGRMTPVPLDRVAPTALYPARMPATLVWPDGCPVCGAPTVREVAAQVLQVEALKSAVATVGNSVANVIATSTTQILVPHCAAHDDGVKLQGEISGGVVDLVFRSYPFQRSFCERNAVRSAPFMHAGRSSGPLARIVPRS